MSSVPPPSSDYRANPSAPSTLPAGKAIKPFSLSPSFFFLVALAIVLLSTFLELGALSNGKVIDDHDLIDYVPARGCGADPLSCFQHPQFGLYYRPLMAATFSFGADLHGTRPFPFHVENLLLHAADVALACWMFRLIFRRDAPALMAGAFFGLHPLHVPVTTFIGGRTDTLALFFLFWFAIGLLKSGGIESRKADSNAAADIPASHLPARLFWRGVSLLAFTAALFTKEQCLPLALLIPLLGTLDASNRPQRRPRLWMLFSLLPILLFLAAAHRVIPAGAVDRPEGWDAGLRIEMVGRTLWYYAKAFFWPTVRTLHQSSLGPWDTPQLLITLLGFSLASGWLALLAYLWPHRSLRVLLLWTTLTLLPVLNLVPIPSQFIASYRAVLPLVGLAGLAGAFCFPERRPEEDGTSPPAPLRLGQGRSNLDGSVRRTVDHRITRQVFYRPDGAFPIRLFLAAAVCLVFAFLSLEDVPRWRSDLTVEQTQSASDPNFLPALTGMAGALHNDRKYAEALPVYDQVVARLFPIAGTEENYIAQGRAPDMARRVKSQSSLRYKPAEFINIVLRGRGGARQNLGMWKEAASDYRIALAFRPNDEEVRDGLARCYVMTDNLEAAEILQRDLVTRVPNGIRWHRLGIIYYRQQRWKEAQNALNRALAQTPADTKTQREEIQRLLDATARNTGMK